MYVEDVMHYGVKGMKWGVRKQRSTGGSKTSGRVKQYLRRKYNLKEKDVQVKPDDIIKYGYGGAKRRANRKAQASKTSPKKKSQDRDVQLDPDDIIKYGWYGAKRRALKKKRG